MYQKQHGSPREPSSQSPRKEEKSPNDILNLLKQQNEQLQKRLKNAAQNK